MDNNLFYLLMAAGFVGVASGYLGSFMVLKRMALVGDALSHVALPGMAIALALNYSPIMGAITNLTLAVFGIWYLAENSSVYPEALVGVFFTASLALGVLITPEPDLLEALFGTLEKISMVEVGAAILFSILIILITKVISKKVILGVISEELVASLGISNRKINLIYLLMVGGIVAMGVKFVGTLLMGALVIIPAASAKNISGSIKEYHLYSAVFGLVSAFSGVFIANLNQLSSGPIVVLTSIAIFIVTYGVRKIKNG